MGIPLPAGVGATGTPPAQDQANGVVTGSFAAVGPGVAFGFYGPFNLAIWGDVNTALTTSAGSTAATVAADTDLDAGQPIVSANVPPGTTIGAISGTDVTLALPPGAGTAGILGGTDDDALFIGTVWSGSVQLERSFDGGNTWLVCGVGGAGNGAVYSGSTQNGVPVSVVVAEPERGVAYRLNCTSYASGTINYRLSASGAAAMAWAVSSAI